MAKPSDAPSSRSELVRPKLDQEGGQRSGTVMRRNKTGAKAPAMSRARKLFQTYLDAYNAEHKKRGMPEVKAKLSIADFWREPVKTVSTDDLYRDFLENLVDDMWKDAEVGFKVLRGSAKGQRGAYGSAEAKIKTRATYQAEVDKLRTAHPDWSKNSVCVQAGKNLKKSAKTIQRHTTDKGPQKS